MKIIVEKKKIVIVKNNIAIRIAEKVSRYIDASMNRATPRKHTSASKLIPAHFQLRKRENNFFISIQMF